MHNDFHLSENHYATLEAFKRLTYEASSDSDALLLLGDIFDIWIGEDIIKIAPEWLEEILLAIKQATRKILTFYSNTINRTSNNHKDRI